MATLRRDDRRRPEARGPRPRPAAAARSRSPQPRSAAGATSQPRTAIRRPSPWRSDAVRAEPSRRLRRRVTRCRPTGVRMIPISTPKRRAPGLDQTGRQQPRHPAAPPARRPGVRLTSTSRGATATCRRPSIEYYYYDQLGSFYSDQPDEPDLWEVDRFVDEVEQVRQALAARPRRTSSCSATPGAASWPSSTPSAIRSICAV